MASFWYACASYLSRRRASYLVLVFLSMLAMVTFHTLFASIMIGGLCGGVFLLLAFRRGAVNVRALLALVAVSLAATAVAAPYLYSITHLKESEHFFPIRLMVEKTGGIIITCALVAVLAVYQARRLWRDKSTAAHFLVFTTIALIIVGNLIELPGSNKFDKPVFFIFFPLAVVGGWTFADRLVLASKASRRRVALAAFLLLVPVNAIALLGYVNTERIPHTTVAEDRLAEWVRENTARDAVFFDDEERAVLLVTAPRRYYWGRAAYAEQWGYPKDEMERRRNLHEGLLNGELTPEIFRALASMPHDAYFIAHDSVRPSGQRVFDRYPALFERVFSDGSIHLFRVDRKACRYELQHSAAGVSNPGVDKRN
jgi:hypothetical protein